MTSIHMEHIDVITGSNINILRPRQNGRLFADDSFKRIFLKDNIRVSIIISLKFVSKGLINNIPALVLIMAWRRPGDKPLSEPMLVRSLTPICVTRPQWVNPWPLGLLMAFHIVLLNILSNGVWLAKMYAESIITLSQQTILSALCLQMA